MDQACVHCKQICKRLEVDDEPKHYLYNHLKPEEVLHIIENLIKEYQGKFLQLIDTAQSDGHQLAVMLKASDANLQNEYDHCIVFVSQASYDADGFTDMWIRYGTPNACCQSAAVVDELTTLVNHILTKLTEADNL